MPRPSRGALLAAIVPLLALAARWSELPFGRDNGIEYCYNSVVTLATGDGPQIANCFTVLDGNFVSTRNFTEDEKAERGSSEQPKRYVLPGLHDGHGHVLDYGQALNSVKLNGAKSIAEVQERIKDWVAKRGEKTVTPGPEWGSRDRWIRGGGWDQGLFGGETMPTAAELDDDPSLQGKYMILARVDLHCIWVSPAVLSLLPSPLPASPPGGEIVTSPGPGVFCDNAMDIVLAVMPAPTTADKTEDILAAFRELHKHGITAVTDEMSTPNILAIYRSLADENMLPLRLNTLLECYQRNTFCPDAFPLISLHPSETLRIAGVKLFGDGALGSWGAAMLEPYSDKPTSSGGLLINETSLDAVVRDWYTAGWQVHVHAIGDAANRAAISAFSRVLPADGSNPNRARLEHAQIIHPADQERILKLGIIPSIQPTHATSDSAYAESRLGKDRLESSAYRMRSLLDAGANLILGSDFPVESPDVFEGIYAAVTRTAMKTPPGRKPFLPKERLSLDQALRGFTNAPAWGAGWEGRAGEVSVGAWADWIVIDREISGDANVQSLREVKVLETWLGGKRVYAAGLE